MLPRLLAFALLLVSTALPRPACADSPTAVRTLTSQGRFVLAGTVAGMWSHELQPIFKPESVWMLRLEGAAFYCLRSRLCVGLTANYAAGRAREAFAEGYELQRDDSDIAVGATALLDMPFHERFSLFVQPVLGWVMQQHGAILRANSGDYAPYRAGPDELYLQYLRASVRFPLVAHLGSHWALGLGPEVDVDILLASKDRSDRFEEQSSASFVAANKARLQLGFALTLYGSL